MLQLHIEGPDTRRDETTGRDEVTIGRASGNDIVLDDDSVSRFHARVVERAGTVFVEDLGGTNGTRLNGRLLRSEAAQVAPGDAFIVGPYTVSVSVSAGPGPETLAGAAAEVRPVVDVHAAGRTFSCTIQRDELTIGRGEANDIAIDAPTLSLNHAMIVRQDDGWRLIDLRSRNGTTLNGQPVESATLHDGDTIGLGVDVTIRFHLGPERLAATAMRSRGQAIVPHPSGAARLRIGRSAGNELVLDSPQVSRTHAVLEREDAGAPWIITDLQSMNRTYVNNDPVGARELVEGDVVRIGPFRLTVRQGEIEHFDETSGVLVEAFALCKTVGKGKQILRDVSLVVQPHEFIAIVGASGAGKSTLLGALSGLRPATTGQVLLNGFSLYEHFDSLRNQIGYVPQDDIIHRELTAQRALDYAAELRMPADTSPAERAARVSEVIAELGLKQQRDTPVANLSGGQRKRVSIGVELLTKPPLFFLDEPTSGLDPGTETRMMTLLRQLADQGRTILLITHATHNIAQCDQVAFMAGGGRLAFFGPPDAALQYFGVGRFEEIYDLIEEQRTPEDWEARFRGSALYREQITARTVNRPGEASAAQVAARRATAPPGRHGARNEAWRQFGILTRRYRDIVLRDRKNLAILLVQAPFIALLLWGLFRQPDLFSRPGGYLIGRDGVNRVAFVGSACRLNPDGTAATPAQCFIDKGDGNWKAAKATQLAFILAATAVWLGTLNAIREVSKEDAIYRRERLVNLRVLPYIASKFVVLLGLVLVQTTLLLGVVAVRISLPGVASAGGIWFSLVLGGAAAVAIALAVSAAVSNPDRAVFAAPLLMLPQILFAGLLSPLKELGPVEPLAAFVMSRWTFEAVGRATGILGRAVWLPDTFQYRDSLTGGPATRWLILVGFTAAFGALAVGLQKLKDRR